MIIAVRVFGILIVGMGIFFAVNPLGFKQYISFWKQTKHIKNGGILSVVIGIVFLMAASKCRMELLINILGLLAIIKGVLLLTIAQKHIINYIDWWNNKTPLAAQILGGFAAAFGILIIYAA